MIVWADKGVMLKVLFKRCVVEIFRVSWMSACDFIFECRIMWDCRHNLMMYGGIFLCCAVIYINTRVNCINFFIHNRTK